MENKEQTTYNIVFTPSDEVDYIDFIPDYRNISEDELEPFGN